MINYRNRHCLWFRLIALAVVCLFFANSICWAYTPDRPAASDTLRAQSIFQPLRDAGIEVTAKHEFEILAGIRLIYAGKPPTVVNGFLTETYRGSRDKRKIEFLENVTKEGESVRARFRMVGKNDMVFEIVYSSTGADDSRSAVSKQPAIELTSVFRDGDRIEITRVGATIKGKPLSEAVMKDLVARIGQAVTRHFELNALRSDTYEKFLAELDANISKVYGDLAGAQELKSVRKRMQDELGLNADTFNYTRAYWRVFVSKNPAVVTTSGQRLAEMDMRRLPELVNVAHIFRTSNVELPSADDLLAELQRTGLPSVKERIKAEHDRIFNVIYDNKLLLAGEGVADHKARAFKDHYAILGLDPRKMVSATAVQLAYKKRSKAAETDQERQDLKEALDVLGDGVRRKAYNAEYKAAKDINIADVGVDAGKHVITNTKIEAVFKAGIVEPVKEIGGVKIFLIGDDGMLYLDRDSRQKAHAGISRNQVYIAKGAYKEDPLLADHECIELRLWRAEAVRRNIPYDAMRQWILDNPREAEELNKRFDRIARDTIDVIKKIRSGKRAPWEKMRRSGEGKVILKEFLFWFAGQPEIWKMDPPSLGQDDFHKAIESLNGEALYGLYGHYNRSKPKDMSVLGYMFQDLGMEITKEILVEKVKGGARIDWTMIRESDSGRRALRELLSWLASQPEIKKTHAASLMTGDFKKAIAALNGETLGGLYSQYNRNKPENTAALGYMFRDLGIEMTRDAVIERIRSGELIDWKLFREVDSGKRAMREFLIWLASQPEIKKTHAASLMTGDFKDKAIAALNGNTLVGLYHQYDESKPEGMTALGYMFQDLGIEMTKEAVIEKIKSGERVDWMMFRESDSGKRALKEFLFWFASLPEIGKTHPASLGYDDFNKAIASLNGETLSGLYAQYANNNPKDMSVLGYMLQDLGIGITKEALVDRIKGDEQVDWKMFRESGSGKRAMREFLFWFASQPEIGKTHPASLGYNDYNKAIASLNGKTLRFFYAQYIKNNPKDMAFLDYMLQDLGMQNEGFALEKIVDGIEVYRVSDPSKCKIPYKQRTVLDDAKERAIYVERDDDAYIAGRIADIKRIQASKEVPAISRALSELIEKIKSGAPISWAKMRQTQEGKALVKELLYWFTTQAEIQKIDPVNLETGDFNRAIASLNGKALSGLHSQYMKNKHNDMSVLGYMFQDLGIEITRDALIEKIKRGVNIDWKLFRESDSGKRALRELLFWFAGQPEIGKAHPASLTADDLKKALASLNGKTLGGLYKQYSKNKPKDITTLGYLFQDLGIEITKEVVIDKIKNGENVDWDMFRESDSGKRALRDLLFWFAGQPEIGKTHPASLTASDFNMAITSLNGKTLVSLHSHYSTKNKPKDMTTLGYMFQDLGIEITRDAVIEKIKGGEQIDWKLFRESDSGKRALRELLFWFAGQPEIGKAHPASLISDDFKKPLVLLNGGTLVVFYDHYLRSKPDDMSVLGYMFQDLGIEITRDAVIEKIKGGVSIDWQMFGESDSGKRALRELLFWFAGQPEIGKAHPASLDFADFNDKAIASLNGKTLSSLYQQYNKNKPKDMTSLGCMFQDLGIEITRDAVVEKIKSGVNIDWQMFGESDSGKRALRELLFWFAGQPEIGKANPAGLTADDFKKAVASLNGETLGIYRKYETSSSKPKDMTTVKYMLQDLGMQDEGFALEKIVDGIEVYRVSDPSKCKIPYKQRTVLDDAKERAIYVERDDDAYIAGRIADIKRIQAGKEAPAKPEALAELIKEIKSGKNIFWEKMRQTQEGKTVLKEFLVWFAHQPEIGKTYPANLATSDFNKAIASLNGEILIGLYNQYYNNKPEGMTTLGYMLKDLDVEITKEALIEKIKSGEQVEWNMFRESDSGKAALGEFLFWFARQPEIGKIHPSSLLAQDFRKAIASLNGAKLDRLLVHYATNKPDNMTILGYMLQDLGIEITRDALIEKMKTGEYIDWKMFRDSDSGRRAIREFLFWFASQPEIGKTHPASLNGREFTDKVIASLNGNKIGGLYSHYREDENKPKNLTALGYMFQDLGIEITREALIEKLKMDTQIDWDMFRESDSGRRAMRDFLFWFANQPEIGKTHPASLLGRYLTDKAIAALNGRVLSGLYSQYYNDKKRPKDMNPVIYMLQDLGIQGEGFMLQKIIDGIEIYRVFDPSKCKVPYKGRTVLDDAKERAIYVERDDDAYIAGRIADIKRILAGELSSAPDVGKGGIQAISEEKRPADRAVIISDEELEALIRKHSGNLSAISRETGLSVNAIGVLLRQKGREALLAMADELRDLDPGDEELAGLIRRYNGDLSEIADKLGVARKTLLRWLEKEGRGDLRGLVKWVKEGIAARSWQNIYDYAMENGIGRVYVDLDGTLFRPAGWVGTEDWLRTRMEETDNAFTELADHEYRMAEAGFFEPADSDTIAVIKRLQENGVEVVAMTARPSRVNMRTKKVFESLGIDIPILNSSRQDSGKAEKIQEYEALGSKNCLFVDNEDRYLAAALGRNISGLSVVRYDIQEENRLKDPDHYLGKGNAYLTAGRIREAVECYINALEVTGRFVEKIDDRIRIFTQVGKKIEDIGGNEDLSAFYASFQRNVASLIYAFQMKRDDLKLSAEEKDLFRIFFKTYFDNDPEDMLRYYEDGLIEIYKRRYGHLGEEFYFSVNEKNLYPFIEPILRYIMEAKPRKILLVDTGARPIMWAVQEFVKEMKLDCEVYSIPVSTKTNADSLKSTRRWIGLGKAYKEGKLDLASFDEVSQNIIRQFAAFQPLSGEKVLVIDDNITSGDTVDIIKSAFAEEGVDSITCGTIWAFMDGKIKKRETIKTYGIEGKYSWNRRFMPVGIKPRWEKELLLRGIKYRKPFAGVMSVGEIAKDDPLYPKYETFRNGLLANFRASIAKYAASLGRPAKRPYPVLYKHTDAVAGEEAIEQKLKVYDGKTIRARRLQPFTADCGARHLAFEPVDTVEGLRSFLRDKDLRDIDKYADQLLWDNLTVFRITENGKTVGTLELLVDVSAGSGERALIIEYVSLDYGPNDDHAIFFDSLIERLKGVAEGAGCTQLLLPRSDYIFSGIPEIAAVAFHTDKYYFTPQMNDIYIPEDQDAAGFEERLRPCITDDRNPNIDEDTKLLFNEGLRIFKATGKALPEWLRLARYRFKSTTRNSFRLLWKKVQEGKLASTERLKAELKDLRRYVLDDRENSIADTIERGLNIGVKPYRGQAEFMERLRDRKAMFESEDYRLRPWQEWLQEKIGAQRWYKFGDWSAADKMAYRVFEIFELKNTDEEDENYYTFPDYAFEGPTGPSIAKLVTEYALLHVLKIDDLRELRPGHFYETGIEQVWEKAFDRDIFNVAQSLFPGQYARNEENRRRPLIPKSLTLSDIADWRQGLIDIVPGRHIKLGPGESFESAITGGEPEKLAVPKSGSVIVSEVDKNHGLVLKVYSAEDFEIPDLRRPIAVYKYFKGAGVVRIDPAKLDIVDVYYGKQNIKPDRYIYAAVTESKEGQPQAVVYQPGRRDGKDAAVYEINTKDARKLIGKEVAVAIEYDPNHGIVVKVYKKTDFDKKDLSAPLAVYLKDRPVDLARLDIVDVYHGRKNIAYPGRSITLKLAGNMIDIAENGREARFEVPEDIASQMNGKEMELVVVNDPDYGPRIDLQHEGKHIATYMYYKGFCKPFNVGALSLFDFAKGRPNAYGFNVRPRVYVSNEPVQGGSIKIGVRGRAMNIDGLEQLNGKMPIFVPQHDLRRGTWIIKVYDAAQYDSTKPKEEDARLVRDPKRRLLVPSHRVLAADDELDLKKIFDGDAVLAGLTKEQLINPATREYILSKYSDRYSVEELSILIGRRLTAAQNEDYEKEKARKGRELGGGGDSGKGRITPVERGAQEGRRPITIEKKDRTGEIYWATEIIKDKFYEMMAKDPQAALRRLEEEAEKSKGTEESEAYSLAYKYYKDVLEQKIYGVKEELAASLKLYQREGVKSMAESKNSILADEPGLGKTLQVIMAILNVQRNGRIGADRALVVVPNAAVSVWREEIEKWTERDHDVVVISGCGARAVVYNRGRETRRVKLEDLIKEYDDKPPANTPFFIVTYGAVRGDFKGLYDYVSKLAPVKYPSRKEDKKAFASFCKKYQRFDWLEKDMLAALEADLRDTIGGQAVKRIEEALGKRTHAAFGTFDFIKRGLKSDFIVLDEAHRIRNSDSLQSRALLQINSAPHKILVSATPVVGTEIDKVWPLLTWLYPEEYPSFSAFQKKFPETLRGRLALFRELKKHLIRRKKDQVAKELKKIREPVNIPVELGSDVMNSYQKLFRLFEKKISAEVARTGKLPPKQFILKWITRFLQVSSGLRFENDDFEGKDVKVAFDPDNAKVKALDKEIEKIQARTEPEKVLIFAKFRETAQALKKRYEAKGIGVCYMDGESATTDTKRQAQIDAFQKDPQKKVFICTYGTGSESITLTAANNVILYDLDWFPPIQPINRVHRIGQTKEVNIIKLIAGSTIDENILQIHDDKQLVFEQSIDGIWADVAEVESDIAKELAEKALAEAKMEAATAGEAGTTAPVAVEKAADERQKITDAISRHLVSGHELKALVLDVDDTLISKNETLSDRPERLAKLKKILEHIDLVINTGATKENMESRVIPYLAGSGRITIYTRYGKHADGIAKDGKRESLLSFDAIPRILRLRIVDAMREVNAKHGISDVSYIWSSRYSRHRVKASYKPDSKKYTSGDIKPMARDVKELLNAETGEIVNELESALRKVKDCISNKAEALANVHRRFAEIGKIRGRAYSSAQQIVTEKNKDIRKLLEEIDVIMAAETDIIPRLFKTREDAYLYYINTMLSGEADDPFLHMLRNEEESIEELLALYARHLIDFKFKVVTAYEIFDKKTKKPLVTSLLPGRTEDGAEYIDIRYIKKDTGENISTRVVWDGTSFVGEKGADELEVRPYFYTTPYNKEFSVKHFMSIREDEGLKPENMIIVGDSIGEFGNDRPMFDAFPEATRIGVNVTAADTPKGVVLVKSPDAIDAILDSVIGLLEKTGGERPKATVAAGGSATFSSRDERRLSAENRDEIYLLARSSEYLKGRPVNMRIDLTAIPHHGLSGEAADEQLRNNMETIAYLAALHNAYGLDVRYILEGGADSSYRDKAQAMLKEKLAEVASKPGIDSAALLSRIGAAHSGERVVEVYLKRTDSIDKAQGVKEREYIVGLKEEAAGASLPNYTASSAIGLSLAALGVARESAPEDYNAIRDNIRKKLADIYSRAGISTDGLTTDVVDMMVSGSSDTKLYYALLYALPPIVKALINELPKYYKALHLLLQAA